MTPRLRYVGQLGIQDGQLDTFWVAHWLNFGLLGRCYSEHPKSYKCASRLDGELDFRGWELFWKPLWQLFWMML